MLIYKYLIEPGYNAIMLPIDSKILSFRAQGANFYIWVLHDDESDHIVAHDFYAASTGQTLNENFRNCAFIGTAQSNNGLFTLVLHLFELTNDITRT